MLKYYQTFGKYNVPASLKGELRNSDGNPIDQIEPLNRINVFVGANNHGKSILIRELLKTDSDAYYAYDIWAKILE